MRRCATRDEEEGEREIAVDRKRLPKMYRAQAKTRSLMFRESLRISQCDATELAQRVRAFDEQEKVRIARALADYDAKASRRLTEVKATNETSLYELEEIQTEKRKMLLEQETTKLAQYDEEYAKVMYEFRHQLKPRKQ